MKTKRVSLFSLIVLFIAVVFMGIHRFFFPFPDAAVRGIGIVMLLGLFVFSYSTVKSRKIKP